jgi:hypothetical protein
VFLAIKGRDRGSSLFIAAHFHETETLAAAGFPVGDDFGALDGAMCAEQFLQSRAIHIVAHVTDIQLLAHVCSPKESGLKSSNFTFRTQTKEAQNLGPKVEEKLEKTDSEAELKLSRNSILSLTNLPQVTPVKSACP